MKEQLICKDNAFPQMLLLSEFSYEAAGKIYHAVVRAEAGEKHLKPLLHPYEPEGSTLHVDFDTVRPVFSTSPDRCHVSHVVADTESWEQKLAQSLEDMEEVHSYIKNHNIGFAIPYTFNGQEKSYYPDFIARIDDGHGPDDLLNLIIEVTGEDKKDKAAKVETAKTLWINNHCGFGRWAFLEVKDPWNSKNEIRKLF
jgi:type III restriction enzyme